MGAAQILFEMCTMFMMDNGPAVTHDKGPGQLIFEHVSSAFQKCGTEMMA